MGKGGGQCCVEMGNIPVDGLRHEGYIRDAERDGEGIVGGQWITERVGIGREPFGTGGGCLFFGEAVDGVVEDHDRHIHVVAYGMYPMGGSNGEAIAVAGRHPNVEIGTP